MFEELLQPDYGVVEVVDEGVTDAALSDDVAHIPGIPGDNVLFALGEGSLKIMGEEWDECLSCNDVAANDVVFDESVKDFQEIIWVGAVQLSDFFAEQVQVGEGTLCIEDWFEKMDDLSWGERLIQGFDEGFYVFRG